MKALQKSFRSDMSNQNEPMSASMPKKYENDDLDNLSESGNSETLSKYSIEVDEFKEKLDHY